MSTGGLLDVDRVGDWRYRRAAATATFAGYYVTRLLPDVDLDEARTTATLVLLLVGLLVLASLVRPLTRPRRALIATMAVAMVLAVVVPPVRTFFALDPPPPIVVLAARSASSRSANG